MWYEKTEIFDAMNILESTSKFIPIEEEQEQNTFEKRTRQLWSQLEQIKSYVLLLVRTELAKYNASAIIIQKVWRGYESRKHYKVISNLKKQDQQIIKRVYLVYKPIRKRLKNRVPMKEIEYLKSEIQFLRNSVESLILRGRKKTK